MSDFSERLQKLKQSTDHISVKNLNGEKPTVQNQKPQVNQEEKRVKFIKAISPENLGQVLASIIVGGFFIYVYMLGLNEIQKENVVLKAELHAIQYRQ
jgi:hypothetical protein